MERGREGRPARGSAWIWPRSPLLRAASRLDAQVEAIVDIGAQVTSVVVHADGEPLIVRTVPRGGTEITESMADPAGHRGRPRPRRSSAASGCTATAARTPRRAAADAVRPLVNELRSSFTYLASGERQKQVTRIALCGGSALMPGLAEHLQQQLGVTVMYADSASRLRDTRKARQRGFDSFVPSAAVSIGLTLGAAA